MQKYFTSFVVLLSLAGQALAGGARQATLHVSAVVLPAARLEVQSATAVTVRVTMYPNVNAMVWADTDSCTLPRNPKTISAPGIHQLVFSPEEVQGTNLYCLTSTDGVLNLAITRPQ